MRNLLVLYSAMYTLPRVSTARRALPAVLKVGAAPSTAPAVGLPTQVETFHCTGASLQGHRAQAEAPTLLERPLGQGVHAVDPASAAKVPAGQGRAGAPLLPPGQKNPGAQAVQVRSEGARENPGAHRGKGEGVRVAVLLRVALRVAVGEVVGVHVESGVLEPLRVGVGEGVGEGELEGVSLGEAPTEGVAVRVGVAAAVLVGLRVTMAVREVLAVGVFVALAEGKHAGGSSSSSMRRRRWFKLSVIQSVLPEMASPEGELNLAEAAGPSRSPPPPEVRELTTTACQAVTSPTMRMFMFTLSAM